MAPSSLPLPCQRSLWMSQVVNALWMILTGERLSLTDKRLLTILQSVENVLKSAQVASLVALLFPDLFKWFSPRYERARIMFEDCKSLMHVAIQNHIVSTLKEIKDYTICSIIDAAGDFFMLQTTVTKLLFRVTSCLKYFTYNF